jgi:hypothetical protein
MYDEDAMGVSSSRHWACSKSGEKDMGDGPRGVQQATAVTTETKDKVDPLIWDDHHIMTCELCSAIGTETWVVMIIIRELDCRKVCARWVPKMLTVGETQQPKKHLCRTSPVQ